MMYFKYIKINEIKNSYLTITNDIINDEFSNKKVIIDILTICKKQNITVPPTMSFSFNGKYTQICQDICDITFSLLSVFSIYNIE